MEDSCVVFDSEDEVDTIQTERPLIDLFNRLIHSENKQNTVLTNAQIADIMQKEFFIDISSLHGLEEEIYLTIMKKFLKDWPEWDDFDKTWNALKTKTNSEKQQVFESNYESLKKYLKSALDAAIPLAKEAVQDVVDKFGTESSQSDVVLEIQSSRDQLRHLFFRYPNFRYKDSIFNISPEEPSHITFFNPSLQSILNWWDVNITIFPPTSTKANTVCLYRRESKHEFKHVLVNKNLITKPVKPKPLDQELKFSGNYKQSRVETVAVIDLLKKICQKYSLFIKNIEELLDFVIKDLLMLPSEIFPSSNYKRYTNKYSYVRHLSKDVKHVSPENLIKYDIHLEETISPAYQIYVGNIELLTYKMSENENEPNMPDCAIVVDCRACSAIFKGCDLISELKNHFGTHHQKEVDFKCTNCEKEFAVEALSQNWWCHKC